MNVFNRKAKELQRDRAASDPQSRGYDYLRDEIAHRLIDRVHDILQRKFPRVLKIGTCTASSLKHLQNIPGVEEIVIYDSSAKMLYRDAELDEGKVKPQRIHGNEEELPFEPESFDMVVSNLALHWVNDLPGCLAQVRQALKPDGLFLASMFGTETLWQLKNAFLVGEQERDGGISNHVSPFVGVSDAGDLLTRARFALPTVDQETLDVEFGDMFSLMRDLRGMGESNAQHYRRPYVPLGTFLATAAAYRALYALPNGNLPATFQIIYMIGWRPHTSQQKPKERGTAEFSLSEFAEKVGELKVIEEPDDDGDTGEPGGGSKTPAST